MSDLNVTVIPGKSLDASKEGVALPSKEPSHITEALPPSKAEPAQQTKKTKPTSSTDLNYSIDHKDNALHLKVQRADGELIREVVFERIDPSLLNAKKLKGIFVDGNS